MEVKKMAYTMVKTMVAIAIANFDLKFRRLAIVSDTGSTRYTTSKAMRNQYAFNNQCCRLVNISIFLVKSRPFKKNTGFSVENSKPFHQNQA
jgi:hypothetical protein